jgi:hypothetical protein
MLTKIGRFVRVESITCDTTTVSEYIEGTSVANGRLQVRLSHEANTRDTRRCNLVNGTRTVSRTVNPTFRL